MIEFSRRLDLMGKLGHYLAGEDPGLTLAKQEAFARNPWFIPDFIAKALSSIREQFLQSERLEQWISAYPNAFRGEGDKVLGIVMAGNIPLVGFHDFLCGWLSGHRMRIKLSCRDEVLLSHIIQVLGEWEPRAREGIGLCEQLKGCDAYIATGSDSSAKYFESYFAKYPHIIRRNRTSVAILDGTEGAGELNRLAEDIFLYFGQGCRSVTQVYVPENYDFLPLLDGMDKYRFLADHNKYRNNLDYQLALLLLNKTPFMSRPHLLVVEEASPFAPISVLHYQHYRSFRELREELKKSDRIQGLVSGMDIPFGRSQEPALSDWADGLDTLAFLDKL